MKKKPFFVILLFLFTATILYSQADYQNFKVAIYTRAYEVQKMEDPHWLDSTWALISSQLSVDKIYLETHRDLLIVDQKTLSRAKEFFESRGLEVAGGITYTIDESNLFETFCYTNPEHRKKVKEIIEYSALNFDEVILDDFFFTSCKCELCMNAKGNRSWSEYRLELMTEASESLIMHPARTVNPNVEVTIKYPNWYDHFHELGFNLETQPGIFDKLHSGTETRDAVHSNQHLQQYHGYLIFRYLNNLKPGKNAGGWVDTGGMIHFDRYAEQLWLTILAKAPEMTLFDYRQMLYPLRENLIASWSEEACSFNYPGFLPLNDQLSVAKAAAHSLNTIDKIVGELGTPIGIKSYKPFHSSGEDFLQNYLGMIGIPIDLVPYFPEEEEMIILTEQASYDPEIVGKIEARLLSGKDLIISSGLLKALEDRGIRNLVNLRVSNRKSMVSDFMTGRRIVEGNTPMLIPQIEYFTNDSWELVSGMDGGLGWPFLHMARVGDATLYVLTIPDNFSDLYNLPVEVLERIRQTICTSLPLSLSAPSKTSLFLYDNNTFVIESFNDDPVEISILFSTKIESISEIPSGAMFQVEVIPEIKFRNRVFVPERYKISFSLAPHSFKAFRF